MPVDASSVAADVPDGVAGGPIRVLHVDDEPDLLEIAAVYLQREHGAIEVTTETDVGAALDRLDDGDADCVVSDYEMPDRDGLQFLRAVRAAHGDLPFILFTGRGSEEIASEAISAGVTDYLQKGTGTDQYALLANRVANAVAQYRAERRVERGFRAIETAREGIAILDDDGRFQYVNPAYADLVGYDRSALVGEHWELLYEEGDADRVREEILPSIPEEGCWTGESVYVRGDGERLRVDHALAYTDEGSMICLIREFPGDRSASE